MHMHGAVFFLLNKIIDACQFSLLDTNEHHKVANNNNKNNGSRTFTIPSSHTLCTQRQFMYLKLRRQIILYETKLHWPLRLLQNTQNHYFEDMLIPATVGLYCSIREWHDHRTKYNLNHVL